MTVILTAVGIVLLATVLWIKSRRDQRELEEHSITPEVLYSLLTSKKDLVVFDVRQPLDFLADSEIIPGAKRLSPKEVLANPSLIPQEKDSVVYCTCPSEKTSRAILRQALAKHFLRVKFLRGGLASWKAKGYPVEPYDKPFRLDPGV
jgi:rhodanese-related sulfurtransferase